MHDQYAKLTGVEIHVSAYAHPFILWDAPTWLLERLGRFPVAK